MATAHADYLAFQKTLVRRVAKEVRGELGHLSGRLRSYYMAYLRDVADYERVATKDELLLEVGRARIVLGGDYHSFDQSKKTHLRILRHVLRHRSVPAEAERIVIALECVPTKHQQDLDLYVAGEIDDATFLARTRYRETWGFPFRPYRDLLLLARAQQLSVVAANLAGRTSLRTRDAHMAETISRAADDHPSALVYLVVGDWHLASGHLPRELARLRGSDEGILVIFQNAESIYWKLASRHLEQVTDVVRLHRRAFCVVNATPFVKLASYALWNGHTREAEELARDGILMALSAPHERRPAKVKRSAHKQVKGGERPPEEESGDLSDTLSLFIGAIARFFDLKATVDFALFTSSDASLIERLVRDLAWRGPDFLHEIAVYLFYRRCFYVPEIRAIYVGTPTVNQLGDVASSYLYHTLSGAGPPPEDPKAGFYTRAMRETVAFMGSKIINHKRPYRRLADYARIFANARGQKLFGVAKEQALVAAGYLAHRRLEKAFLRNGVVPRPSHAVFHERPVVRWGLTRGLGQALGHKMYQAMVTGRIGKEVLSQLFADPFPDPFDRYMELVRRTRQIRASVKAGDERL